MTLNKLISDLLEEADNRYELILRVGRLAKQTK